MTTWGAFQAVVEAFEEGSGADPGSYTVPTTDSTSEQASRDTTGDPFGYTYTVPTTGSTSEQAEADTSPDYSGNAPDTDEPLNVDTAWPPDTVEVNSWSLMGGVEGPDGGFEPAADPNRAPVFMSAPEAVREFEAAYLDGEITFDRLQELTVAHAAGELSGPSTDGSGSSAGAAPVVALTGGESADSSTMAVGVIVMALVAAAVAWGRSE